MSRNAIDQCIRDSLDTYFRDLDGEEPSNIVQHGAGGRGTALLEAVMARAERNQSLAAAYLGINRNTLRKKLQQHELTLKRSPKP